MHFGCSEVSTPILLPMPELRINAFIRDIPPKRGANPHIISFSL